MQVPTQLPPQTLLSSSDPIINTTVIRDQNAFLPAQGATLIGTRVVGQPTIINTTTTTATTTSLPHQLAGYAPQQGMLNGVSPAFNSGLPMNTAVPGQNIGVGAGNNVNIGTGTPGTNYSGTYTFRLQQGRFYKDLDWLTPMDPYVKIKIGPHISRSNVAKKQGTVPIWNDVITMERKHFGTFAKIKVKDRDRLSLNDRIGETRIPLAEIAVKGRVAQWWPVFKKEEQTGEVLMEITFSPVI